MTTRSPSAHTPLRHLGRRLIAWLPGHSPAVDYDQVVGVEQQGRIALVIRRDGGRRPIEFRSSRRAAAWTARVQTGLQARHAALREPPNLVGLADGLGAASTTPWSTPDHVLAILVAALGHASVSAAKLEFTEHGVAIRCRRFGRLHLGGALPHRLGATLFEALDTHLAPEREEDGEHRDRGARAGRLTLGGCFPGPTLQANIHISERGARIQPIPPEGLFADLASWGAPSDSARVVRELLGRGPGLVLVIGRRDTGKSTLAKVCETEAQLLRPGVETLVIDEIDDPASAQEALGQAAHRMVIAILRADGGCEALSWLRSLALDGHSLDAAIHGIVETSLAPLSCPLCHGDGCDRCQRCGVIGRRGHLEVTRLESTLDERPAVRPVHRERRKLTA